MYVYMYREGLLRDFHHFRQTHDSSPLGCPVERAFGQGKLRCVQLQEDAETWSFGFHQWGISKMDGL